MRWPAPVLHTNLRHFQTQYHEHSLNHKCKRTFSYYRTPHRYSSFQELILFLKGKSHKMQFFLRVNGSSSYRTLFPNSIRQSASQSSSQFFRNFSDQSYLKFAVIFLLHVSQCTYSIGIKNMCNVHIYESLKKNSKSRKCFAFAIFEEVNTKKKMPPFEHRFRKSLDSEHPVNKL